MHSKLTSAFLIVCFFNTVASAAVKITPAAWSEGDSPGQLQIDASEAGGGATLKAYITDRSGAQVAVWSTPLSGATTMALPKDPFSIAGYYRFQIGTGASVGVSVVPKPLASNPAVPIYGVNTHFAQRAIPDTAYAMLKLANVDLIRDQWVWGSVEKVKGNLQSPSAPNGGPAHQKQMLSQYGIKILHNCAFGNKGYDAGAFPSTPDAIAAFSKYCGFMGKEFGSTLYGSEIWNESDKIDAAKLYSPLALAVSNELKQDTPSAQIIEGGGAGPGGGADPIYEETVYKTIGAACCTGHSVHPYMKNPDVGYLALQGRLKNPVDNQPIVNMNFVTFWLDYVSQSAGKTRASYITEIGWTTALNAKDSVTEDKQAAFVGRALILASKPSACSLSGDNLAAYVNKVCKPSASTVSPDLKSILIYDFIDDGSNVSSSESNFGMLHTDLTPKPSYSAFAQSAGVLRGSTFYKKFDFGNSSLAKAYLFRTGKSSGWLVMWTEEYRPTTIAKSAGDLSYSLTQSSQSAVSLSTQAGGSIEKSRGQCRDWDGHPCTAKGSDVVITNLPVYIEIVDSLETLKVSEHAK